jgi:hypothetical protein
MTNANMDVCIVLLTEDMTELVWSVYVGMGQADSFEFLANVL